MNNYPIYFTKFSPWPILLRINLFRLIINLTRWITFIYCFNQFIILLIINNLTILLLWINNLIINKIIIGQINLYLNLSFKIFIYLIIFSELIFFFSLFYIHLSIKIFLYTNFILKFNLSLFKLNFILALLNLLILLSSRLSITIFCYYNYLHHNKKLKFLLQTIILSIYFIIIQFFEFKILNFNFSNSIFFSNFYLLTTFHFSHVCIGTILIIIRLNYIYYYHISLLIFNKLICWYWHFIDFIWIIIIILIY